MALRYSVDQLYDLSACVGALSDRIEKFAKQDFSIDDLAHQIAVDAVADYNDSRRLRHRQLAHTLDQLSVLARTTACEFRDADLRLAVAARNAR